MTRSLATSVESLVAWTKCVTTLCCRFYHITSENKTPETMTKVMEVLMQNFVSSNRNVSITTTKCISRLMQQCVQESWIDESIANLSSMEKRNVGITAFIDNVEEGLSYRNISSVPQILILIEQLFVRLKTKSFPLMCKVLHKVGSILESEALPQLQSQLQRILGVAIETMGPKQFLSILPLQLELTTSSEQLKHRAYLLPILREHVRNTELVFFVGYFVPLIQSLTQHSQKLDKLGRKADSKDAEMVVEQMWGLLENFCTFPTDMSNSFPSVARSMVSSLSSNSLIEPICDALVAVVRSQKAVIQFHEKNVSKEKKDQVATLASVLNALNEDEEDSEFVPEDEEEEEEEFEEEKEEISFLNSEENSEAVNKEEDSSMAGLNDSESSELPVQVSGASRKKIKEDPFVKMVSKLMHPISVEQAVQNKQILSSFSRQILPALFNAYTKSNQRDSENCILLAVIEYLSVTPKEDINKFFSDVLVPMIDKNYRPDVKDVTLTPQEASTATNKAKRTKKKITIIANLFSEHLSPENCTNFFDLIARTLRGKVAKDVKKWTKSIALSALAQLCKKNAQFVQANFKSLSRLLSKIDPTLDKKSKLRCWLELTKWVPSESIASHLQHCLSEAILGTKEMSAKARSRSRKLVVALSGLYVDRIKSKSISDFVVQLVAGFGANTPRMISASINAIALVLHSHKSDSHFSNSENFQLLFVFQKRKI